MRKQRLALLLSLATSHCALCAAHCAQARRPGKRRGETTPHPSASRAFFSSGGTPAVRMLSPARQPPNPPSSSAPLTPDSCCFPRPLLRLRQCGGSRADELALAEALVRLFRRRLPLLQRHWLKAERDSLGGHGQRQPPRRAGARKSWRTAEAPAAPARPSSLNLGFIAGCAPLHL